MGNLGRPQRASPTWSSHLKTALGFALLTALLATLLTTLLTALATLLTTTLLATLLTALALLPSRARSSWTAWSFVGRLATLLGLSLWSAGLAFVLLLALVLIFGILALCDDQAAVSSARAVKRHAQLWNRNR